MEDIIEINGEKYKKITDVEGGSVKSFGKDLPKVQKALGKILAYQPEVHPLGEVIRADSVAELDAANVCMVEALSEPARVAMQPFVYKLNQKTPKLKFEAVTKGTKYSIDYLKKILDLFEASGDVASIKFADDYPLMLESEHWRVVLAPRAED